MFDIDKLYLARINYKRKRENVEGKKKSRLTSDLTTEFKEGSAKYYQNRMLLGYLALLKDKRLTNMLHTSIDNDTKPLKDIVADLELDIQKNPTTPYQSYTISNQVNVKDEFVSGKQGIGPYALSNCAHLLAVLYGLKFNSMNGILNDLNMTDLSKQLDKDSLSILSWLSGLINGHVDVAKDPWVSRLNINEYTHSLIELMVRVGIGKDTFYFITQPIMKDLATAYKNACGSYMNDNSLSRSYIQKQAENGLILNFINAQYDLTFTDMKSAEDFMERRLLGIFGHTKDKNGITRKLAVRLFEEKANLELMRDVSKYAVSTGTGCEVDRRLVFKMYGSSYDISTADLQYICYKAKQEFEPYAASLNNLVMASQIDTKKQGKNIVELLSFKEKYDDVFNSPTSAFDQTSLHKYETSSFIYTQMSNIYKAFMGVMGEQVFEATLTGMRHINVIKRHCGILAENKNPKLVSKIAKMYTALIKFRYIQKYANEYNVDINGLISGNNTILDRLFALKAKLKTDPLYQDLRDSNRKILNYLFNVLIPSAEHQIGSPIEFGDTVAPDKYPAPKFVKIKDFNVVKNSADENELRQAWTDLLLDNDHPELQKFALDLIVYAFITSGDMGGRNDLFKYVPIVFKDGTMTGRIEESYSDFLQRELNEHKNASMPFLTEQDVEKIILNNWYDDAFVPTVNLYQIKDDGNFHPVCTQYTVKDSDKIRQAALIAGVYEYNGKLNLMFDPTDQEHKTPIYFKVKRPNVTDRYSLRNFAIYKLIGYGTRRAKFADGIHQIDYPIYALVDARGGKYSDAQKIYDFQDIERSDEFIFNMILDEVLIKVIKSIKAKHPEIVEKYDMLTQEGIINSLVDYVMFSGQIDSGFDIAKSNKVLDFYDKFLNVSLANIIRDVTQYGNPYMYDEQDTISDNMSSLISSDKMDTKKTSRVAYEVFGNRSKIGISERTYITENIQSINSENLDISFTNQESSSIIDFLHEVQRNTQFTNKLPYTQYKQYQDENIDRFEKLWSALSDYYDDAMNDAYDRNEKSYFLDPVDIELLKLGMLSDNLANMIVDFWSTSSGNLLRDEDIVTYLSENGLFTYSDSRLLELFSNEDFESQETELINNEESNDDFSPEDEKQGEDNKNNCKNLKL